MARKITALPADEIIIDFNDRELKATFNMLAVGYMQEKLMKPGKEKLSIVEFGSLVLYGGIKANHEDFTIEEARALALSIRPTDLNEIIGAYMESAGTDSEIMDEAKKKIMMQMLTRLVK